MAKTHEAGTSEDTRSGVIVHTADGTIQDRPLENGPYDEFHVSNEDRAFYGIRDNEVPFWPRDPEYWMKNGELTNRVKELEKPVNRGGVGGRIILHPEDGEMIHLGGGTSGDNVLMAIPREVHDRIQRERDAAVDELQNDLVPTDEGWEGTVNTLDYGPERSRRMRAEHQMNQRLGLVGGSSPTAGMTLTQAMSFMANRQGEVEAKAARLRNGASHTTPSLADFRELMSGRPQKRAMAAMGNSGFPRNPKSPLAQAAAREGRK